jgi:hypothetical protein
MRQLTCPLYSGGAVFSRNNKTTKYYQCGVCLALFMNPENHLTPEKEKERYPEHNNDVNDPGYRKFVSPIINTVQYCAEKLFIRTQGPGFRIRNRPGYNKNAEG